MDKNDVIAEAFIRNFGRVPTIEERTAYGLMASVSKKAHNSLAENKLGYNPWRDEAGRFASGPVSGGRLDFSNADQDEFAEAVPKLFPSDVSWSDEELDVIEEYTDELYLEMNRYMRNPDDERIESDEDYLAEHIRILDGALRQELPQDATLYRGFGVNKSEDIAIGAEIIYNGFSSTSFLKSKTLDFASIGQASLGSDNHNAVVLKINAKKGQRGLAPIVALDATKDLTLKQEAEFILPPNVKYKLISKSNKSAPRSFGKDLEYEEWEVEII